MTFSSYEFILLFLPIVLIAYFMLSKLRNAIYQRVFLILASLFFYGYYNVYYLPIIIASISANYYIAVLIQKKKQKLFFVFGIVFNVCLLGFFKYFDFFVENINLLFSSDLFLLNIALPLGISFFTFQQLSFLVSVYKDEEKVEKFSDYCIFVLFFPQLVAGPIVLYSEMIPQFKDEKRRFCSSDNLAKGLYRFCIGLFKKAVVADTFALFVNNGFDAVSLGFTAAWLTALSYTVQIYFDFSGYSDMAIGLGKMFNIDIPENFNSPYRATSVSEFWRKWHTTLGRALSTYVYRPLGGNRKGKMRTYTNLFLTFLVSGIWHGAAWTFVVWGALHGLFVVIERILGKRLEKIPKLIRTGCTFLLINALWVLFRADGFAQAQKVYHGMINIFDIRLSQLPELVFDGLINFPNSIDILYVIGILCAALFVIWFCKSSGYLYNKFQPSRSNIWFAVSLFCLAFLCLSRESVFIYFNF